MDRGEDKEGRMEQSAAVSPTMSIDSQKRELEGGVGGHASAPPAAKRARCEHGKLKDRCKECGGSSVCEHGRLRSKCKDCGGSEICEHGKRKDRCKECGGSSFCEHGKRKDRCKECGGSSFCEHGKRKDRCKKCVGKPAQRKSQQPRRVSWGGGVEGGSPVPVGGGAWAGQVYTSAGMGAASAGGEGAVAGQEPCSVCKGGLTEFSVIPCLHKVNLRVCPECEAFADDARRPFSACPVCGIDMEEPWFVRVF